MEEEEEILQEQEFYEHYRIVADPGQELMRIDKWLGHKIPNASRTKIQAGCDAGAVKVNGQSVKSSYRVKPGDEVVVLLPNPPRETDLIPEEIPLDILYEDQDVLIINKSAGMVVHPGYNNYTGTLVNGLLWHFGQLPQKDANHRPGLVHRIDKDTSGLLVIAKTEFALSFLAKQFYDHSIHRKYYALIWGEPKQEDGTITGYLMRDPQDRRKSKNYKEEKEFGKWAVTHYKVIKRFHFMTLVECRLETGRTHQIRAHMAYISHPIFSDEMYGGREIRKMAHLPKFRQFIENLFELMPRQALHAAELGFVHPTTGKEMFFEAQFPADFQYVLDKIDDYARNHSWQ